MSKSSRTIRWDDPAYSAKSSEDSLNAIGSLSNSSISGGNIPAGNLAMKNAIAAGAHVQQSTSVTSTSWRELKTRDGRPYYYNSVTQKTVWDIPKEYQDYLDFMQKGGGGSGNTKKLDSEGDAIFWEILKERKVTSKWTWEEALRAIITHPNYKCILTLQERKLSFQRYCEAMRSIEEEEARLQSLAIKEAFKAILAGDSQINSDTKWSEVVDRLGRHEAFLAVSSSRERVQLFEEYQSELRRCELELVWARRKAASMQISEFLKDLNISLDFDRGKLPNWHDFKDKLIGLIPGVDPVEYLIAFEEHVQDLVKEYQASRKVERQAGLLKELKYREAFNILLKELTESDNLNPLSMWSSVYPLISDRIEYKNLISIYMYGSSPVDMFYDHLDRIQETYNSERSKIVKYFKTEFMTTEATKLPKLFASYTQFKETLKSALGLEGTAVKYAFIELYGPDAIVLDRNRINAYKHFLKHLNPPIKQTENWTELKDRLKGKDEYEQVQCDEDRELYFLKFKKWLIKHQDVGKANENEIDRGQESGSKKSRWDRREDDTLKDRSNSRVHDRGYRSDHHRSDRRDDSRTSHDKRY